MTLINITVEVEDGDDALDAEHETGVTEDTYLRLTGYTEHGAPPLSWLGEVTEVAAVKEDA